MLLVLYMLIINILAFILYGVDKKKAEKDKYRIPESRLILVAVLGGSFGALLGMIVFRHKIRKNKFRITVPLFAVLYLALIIFILYNYFHPVTTDYKFMSTDKEVHKLMYLYMPDVVGTNIESAKNKLSEMGFFNITVEYVKDDKFESGQIVRQSIPPNTTASTEFEIILYVAK